MTRQLREQLPRPDRERADRLGASLLACPREPGPVAAAHRALQEAHR